MLYFIQQSINTSYSRCVCVCVCVYVRHTPAAVRSVSTSFTHACEKILKKSFGKKSFSSLLLLLPGASAHDTQVPHTHRHTETDTSSHSCSFYDSLPHLAHKFLAFTLLSLFLSVSAACNVRKDSVLVFYRIIPKLKLNYYSILAQAPLECHWNTPTIFQKYRIKLPTAAAKWPGEGEGAEPLSK